MYYLSTPASQAQSHREMDEYGKANNVTVAYEWKPDQQFRMLEDWIGLSRDENYPSNLALLCKKKPIIRIP